MSDETSVNLYHRYRAGDSDAANDIFRRYVDRLVGLVRNRMSRPIQRRVDPEDIVQSAYRVFFDKATSGEFEIRQEGDLWSLLGRNRRQENVDPGAVPPGRQAERRPGRRRTGKRPEGSQ